MGHVLKAIPLRIYGDGAEVLGFLAQLQKTLICAVSSSHRGTQNFDLYSMVSVISAQANSMDSRFVFLDCSSGALQPCSEQQCQLRYLGFVSVAQCSRTTTAMNEFWSGLRGVSAPCVSLPISLIYTCTSHTCQCFKPLVSLLQAGASGLMLTHGGYPLVKHICHSGMLVLDLCWPMDGKHVSTVCRQTRTGYTKCSS